MSYSTPSPFYDILPNDFLQLSYASKVQDSADVGFGQSCHFPPTGGEQPSLYPTYNGLAPFQAPASLPSTFSSSVASSTSGESSQPWVQSSSTLADALTFQPIPEPETQESPQAWAQSSSTLADALTLQPIPEPETRESKVIPAAKKRGKGKRRSGSGGIEIDRPAGSGYAAMFELLSADVQEKVKGHYKCCDNVDKEDQSSLLKHWISERHFLRALGKKRMYLQPVYSCPAFLSMHGLCKSAKAGRYDSMSRHCQGCAGFKKMRKETGIKMAPVQLFRGEHDAVKKFRKNARRSNGVYSERLLIATFKLLAMMATSKTGPPSTDITDPEPSDERAGVLSPDEEQGLLTSNETDEDDSEDDDEEDMLEF